jgi:hypothetical protein
MPLKSKERSSKYTPPVPELRGPHPPILGHGALCLSGKFMKNTVLPHHAESISDSFLFSKGRRLVK